MCESESSADHTTDTHKRRDGRPTGVTDEARAPCVSVAREDGEQTRERLAELGVLDAERAIEAADGRLFVPVTDPTAVPDDLTVVNRPTGERDRQRTPADLLGYEPTYERLGRLILLDEYEDSQAREIADAVMAADVPCDAVLARDSKVRGEYRVREWRLLAGDTTETIHREYGHEFRVDPTEVYFSPRLATERHRVIEQVDADERVIDMFAGVGPFAVPMASRGAAVLACDLNPRAVAYLVDNARRNGVSDRLTAVEGDVRELAREPSDRERPLRLVHSDDTDGPGDEPGAGGDTDDHVPAYRDWADRLVANLPHSTDEFLDTAVALAGEDCVVHYYDIQHEDDPFGPGERAIRTAAEPTYRVTFPDRRVVRSYAPHELNVRLDARLQRTD